MYLTFTTFSTLATYGFKNFLCYLLILLKRLHQKLTPQTKGKKRENDIPREIPREMVLNRVHCNKINTSYKLSQKEKTIHYWTSRSLLAYKITKNRGNFRPKRVIYTLLH